MFSSVLSCDVDGRAFAAAAVTFTAVHAALRFAFRPQPSGALMYRAQNGDGLKVGWLQYFIVRDAGVALSLPAGEGHKILLKKAREVKGDARAHPIFYAGWVERVVVTNPEDMHYLLVANPTLTRKPDLNKILEMVLGRRGLVTIVDEEYHSKQFRAVSHAFAPAAIKNIAATVMLDHFHAAAGRLRREVDATEGGQLRIAVNELLTEVTLGVIAEAAFRTGVGYLKPLVEKLAATLRPSLRMVLPMWLYGLLPMPAENRRVRDSLLVLVKEQIAAVRRGDDVDAGDDVPATRKALIDLLAENPALTDEELLDHTATFVFAGHDTTANALTWLLYLVAKHPQVQETLQDELDDAFAAGARPGLEAVLRLPYLRAVVDETMRHYPSVPAILRTPTRDVVLPASGTYVPAGSTMLVSMYSNHHDPLVWGADAETFRPERWLEDPELKSRVQPCSYMPFGVGKRACIGKDFALHEIMVGAALLLRNFRVEWPADEPEPFRAMRIVVKPAAPLHLHLTCR